jgi:ribosomal protein S18 acetylase RimI-like enzyme
MADFCLRAAGFSDAARLSLIGQATFLESYIETIDANAIALHCQRNHAVEYYQSALKEPRAAAWLIEHVSTSAPVGYALNMVPDLPAATEPDDIELKRIYVFSRYHGSGLASQLMDASIDHARANGAAALWLGTYQDNHRAIAFYKRFGFEPAGTRRFQVGGAWFDDIVMRKAL